MQQVWFLFKFCETILGSICLSFHIMGLDKVESVPHVVFYCGTYFGFTLINMFGSIGILLRRGTKPLMEAIISGTGAIMYIGSSLLAMYHAEHDIHLMYLSDFEEPQHKFFKYCKQQSIASLATGLLFLLHCIFALDVHVVRHRHISIFEDENEEAMQPMRMYFISESVQKYLERYEWFRRYSVNEFQGSSDGGDSARSKKTPHRRHTHRTDHSSQRKNGDERTPSVSPAVTVDIPGKENGTSSVSSISMVVDGPPMAVDKSLNV